MSVRWLSTKMTGGGLSNYTKRAVSVKSVWKSYLKTRQITISSQGNRHILKFPRLLYYNIQNDLFSVPKLSHKVLKL